MERRTSLILGALFILASGLMYSVERVISIVHWSALTHTGSFPTSPPPPSLLDNLFIPLFLLVGIIFIYFAFKRNGE
ncbi:hypothetical protein ACFFF5_08405 [Lederbergia wuyishanensis]|uniref:Uncharacterized protein n=1 Tax=Lederbergia wuyishanensis TaxID=1347903 RepID=A0ABU0D6D6_9BACI|nr:hypothetical protein [Lederbergia wuyishanensis]MCJ8008625.1 hypothetical protein [Lederbergia wuyishanensis]MDQ0343959.1 hypothetical protein [Lederbergia wuyishanensis]